jgi:hypothetical protein
LNKRHGVVLDDRCGSKQWKTSVLCSLHAALFGVRWWSILPRNIEKWREQLENGGKFFDHRASAFPPHPNPDSYAWKLKIPSIKRMKNEGKA